MQGIQPQSLTDRELANYIDLYGVRNLPPEWAEELVKRFYARVQNDDDLK